MNALEIKNVCHSFGPKKILWNVNLTIPQGQFVSLVGPSGCHRVGQLILMFDGTLKTIENIEVGEKLMGMDSTPRTVLSLVRGEGKMVQIIPTKGESFVVNEDHVLTLKRGMEKNKKKPNNKGGQIVDVTVKDWLGWSKNQKNLHKLLRTEVEFKSLV